jgi:hypothetical protein
MQNNKLTDTEFVSGVHVTSFFVSVTFFPLLTRNGGSNDLFLKVVSAVNDVFEDYESQLHWSVQSISDNFYNKEGKDEIRS